MRADLLSQPDSIDVGIPDHRFLSAWLSVLAVALLVISGKALLDTPQSSYPLTVPAVALGLALLGGLVFYVAQLVAGKTNPPLVKSMTPTRSPLTPPRIALLPLMIGIVLLAVDAEASGDLLKLDVLRQLTVIQQSIILLVGMVFVGWGLAGAPLPRLRRRSLFNIEFWIILALLAFALALRLWQMETSLPLLIDELNFLTGVNRGTNDAMLRILAPMSAYAPYTWLYSLTQSLGSEIFPHSLTVMRCASIIFGTAQVGGVYLLARALFERRTAILAAVALASFAPQ